MGAIHDLTETPPLKDSKIEQDYLKALTRCLNYPTGRHRIYQSFVNTIDSRMYLHHWGFDDKAYFKYVKEHPEQFLHTDEGLSCPLPIHFHDVPRDELFAAGVWWVAYEPEDYEAVPESEFWEKVAQHAQEHALTEVLAVRAIMKFPWNNNAPGCHPHPLVRKKATV